MQLAMERMKGSHIAVVCPYAKVGRNGLFFKRQIPGEADMEGIVIEDGVTFMETNMEILKIRGRLGSERSARRFGTKLLFVDGKH